MDTDATIDCGTLVAIIDNATTNMYIHVRVCSSIHCIQHSHVNTFQSQFDMSGENDVDTSKKRTASERESAASAVVVPLDAVTGEDKEHPSKQQKTYKIVKHYAEPEFHGFLDCCIIDVGVGLAVRVAWVDLVRTQSLVLQTYAKEREKDVHLAPNTFQSEEEMIRLFDALVNNRHYTPGEYSTRTLHLLDTFQVPLTGADTKYTHLIKTVAIVAYANGWEEELYSLGRIYGHAKAFHGVVRLLAESDRDPPEEWRPYLSQAYSEYARVMAKSLKTIKEENGKALEEINDFRSTFTDEIECDEDNCKQNCTENNRCSDHPEEPYDWNDYEKNAYSADASHCVNVLAHHTNDILCALPSPVLM